MRKYVNFFFKKNYFKVQRRNYIKPKKKKKPLFERNKPKKKKGIITIKALATYIKNTK